jgi:hypothetical protein
MSEKHNDGVQITVSRIDRCACRVKMKLYHDTGEETNTLVVLVADRIRVTEHGLIVTIKIPCTVGQRI